MPESYAHLLEGLDPAQQRAVVIEPAGPLAILAGAGSGKTTVLTRRVARRILSGDADVSHSVVVTFTRRAARELTGRLAAIGIRDSLTCGTMHSVALGVLAQRWADTGQRPWTVLSQPHELIAPILRRHKVRATPGEVLADIDWARARLVSPESFASAVSRAHRRSSAPPDTVAEVYQDYETAKRTTRAADFNDLLSMCATAAQRDPTFADVMRWRFRHLYVDEFQDLNPLQFALLRTWLGDRGDLCVVGDPQQAIYGWNGADATLLDTFVEHFPSATVIHLDTNHRCPEPILTAASAVLGTSRAVARRTDGAPPTLTGYPDEVAEAAGIAQLLRSIRPPGGAWRSMAVLTRTHAQLAVVQRALESHHIPVTVRSDARRLGPVARSWLADPHHLRIPLASALSELEERCDDADLDPAERTELVRLTDDANDFLAEHPMGTVTALARWLDQRSGDGPQQFKPDGVELVTFHAAKGLEWSTVVVAGVEKGIVPLAHARSPEALAEEHRLLYVAMTRARRDLHLTWAMSRNGAAKGPSPLIDQIAAASSVSPVSGHLEPIERPPAEVVDPEVHVRRALISWRQTMATRARCAAAAVIADDTLDEVAARCPRDLGQLDALATLGPVKRARYGAQLVDVVATALAERRAVLPDEQRADRGTSRRPRR